LIRGIEAMAKKIPPNLADIALFHEAMEGTIPLVQAKVRLALPKLQRVRTQTTPDNVHQDQQFDHDHDDEDAPIQDVQSDEFLSYKQVCISNKILRNLRKGQYTIEAKLDLHGMTSSQAKIAVTDFLAQCSQMGARMILIVHGKGQNHSIPVLKSKVNHWLRHENQVLAFCSAQKMHGCRGALYVLLKSQTQRGEG
jgi:DNA-nicking Smr family endonuclease